MTYRNAILAALAFAGGIALSGPTLGQDGPEMEAMRANCAGDYLRLCAGMKPEGPEVKACFKRNRPNLSDGCSGAIAAYERSRRGASDEADD